jgi:hypothetical protein
MSKQPGFYTGRSCLPHVLTFTLILSCCFCSSLTLRKLKSGNNKLAFGTLLFSPQSPDWRYKMLAQYHFSAVRGSLGWLEMAESCCQWLYDSLVNVAV